MSPTPPQLNPSQTVERIREIIVGRHFERLEDRVARLEKIRAVSAEPSSPLPIFEDRLLSAEAKVEAIQDHLHRIESLGGETAGLVATQREDARLLAVQIQDNLRVKADAAALPAVEKLERKLGNWLGEWQKSLHLHLDDRDKKLSGKFKEELDGMKENVEKRINEIDSHVPRNLEERFNNIAKAARMLADSALALTQAIPPKL